MTGGETGKKPRHCFVILSKIDFFYVIHLILLNLFLNFIFCANCRESTSEDELVDAFTETGTVTEFRFFP